MEKTFREIITGVSRVSFSLLLCCFVAVSVVVAQDAGPSELEMEEVSKKMSEVHGPAGSLHAYNQLLTSPKFEFPEAHKINKEVNEKLGGGTGTGAGAGGGNEEIKYLGRNKTTQREMNFQNFIATRELMKGPIFRETIQESLTSDFVATLVTMQMVENGAAQGLANAFNISNGFISNTIATAKLNMAALEASDTEGQQKVRFWLADWKERSDANGSSLAGLSAVNNDAPNMKSMKQQQLAEIKEIQERGLYTTKHHMTDKKGTGSPGGGQTSETERKLSELLFKNAGDQGTGATGYKNGQDVQKLEQEFTKLLGDFKLKVEKSQDDKGWRTTEWLREKPEVGPKGVMVRQLSESWKAWFNLMKAYCEYRKSGNNNKEAKNYDLDSPVTSDKFKQAHKDNWKKVTAPGMPMSMNVLEQAYTFVRKDRDDQDVDCNELEPSQNKVPEGDAANDLDKGNLDDCKNGKACIRNKLFYHFAETIAWARTLHTYAYLYRSSSRFAQDPWTQELVGNLFESTFQGMQIADELERNSERNQNLVALMAKLQQGRTGGGGSLKPSSSNIAGAHGPGGVDRGT